MFGSPGGSSFRCEACGAHARAAVESLICQFIYTYSSSLLSPIGSMIAMRMRGRGHARLRVTIKQKFRQGLFVRPAAPCAA